MFPRGLPITVPYPLPGANQNPSLGRFLIGIQEKSFFPSGGKAEWWELADGRWTGVGEEAYLKEWR